MYEQFTEANGATMHSILDCIGDGIILTDADACVTYINDAAARILEYEPQKACGRNFEEICPIVQLHTKNTLASPLRCAIENGRIVGLERDAGLVGEAGQLIFLSATCSPIRDTDGKITGGSVILRDVTHMRTLERQLEDERRSLQTMFAVSTIGMCSLNCKGAIISINEAAMNVMQTTRIRAIGMQLGDAFQCENGAENGCGHGKACLVCPVRKNITQAIYDDDFSGCFDVRMRHADQGFRRATWLKVYVAQALVDDEKQIVLALVDISERKQRETDLEKARLEAEAANLAKSQFLANISHEVRTPINGMVGMIELTLRTALQKEQKENLISAKICSEDLLRIINDILDYSKLESGKMRLEEMRFDLHALLQRVAQVYEKIAKEKGLVFFRTFSNGVPRYIRGDSLRLRQILHNLLSNAVKFTSRGRVQLSIVKKQEKDGMVLEFDVSDTGIGIKEKDQKKLFQAFSQVDGSITRRFGGTGLGLMITKELVDLMHGRIEVASKEGEGSRFSFFMPFHKETGADDEMSEATVFVNEAKQEKTDIEEEKSMDTSDVEDLLKYCEDKLKDK